jgi:hypothetical protein
VGRFFDNCELAYSSSQGWASVQAPGFPVTLEPGQTGFVTVTVTIPNDQAARGLTDRTELTVTSATDSTLSESALDRTMVPAAYIYLPLIARSW